MYDEKLYFLLDTLNINIGVGYAGVSLWVRTEPFMSGASKVVSQ